MPQVAAGTDALAHTGYNSNVALFALAAMVTGLLILWVEELTRLGGWAPVAESALLPRETYVPKHRIRTG